MPIRTQNRSDATQRDVVIARRFDAPRALVWRAWTEPEALAQWWGPRGFVTRVEALELRVGGRLLLHLRAPDGSVHPAQGVFRELVAPERLVIAGEAADGHPCGAGLPPRSVVTVTLAEQGNATLLTFHARLAPAAARATAHQAGFDTGWNDSLDALARHLATRLTIPAAPASWIDGPSAHGDCLVETILERRPLTAGKALGT